MYCANCGVRLGDAEKKCPLCGTAAYHPDIRREAAQPLYPENRVPKVNRRSKALGGVIIILFLIPLLSSLLADWQPDHNLTWFGYVAGALVLLYVAFALPLWFQKPNPVIFVPCFFAAAAGYLLYINLATGGKWFLSFAFPAVGALCLITCTVVTLLYYLRRGRLYIWGSAFIAMGGYMLLIEFLLGITFRLPFTGWSFYPLIGFVMLGGTLIYLAIDRSAREVMEQKLFF